MTCSLADAWLGHAVNKNWFRLPCIDDVGNVFWRIIKINYESFISGASIMIVINKIIICCKLFCKDLTRSVETFVSSKGHVDLLPSHLPRGFFFFFFFFFNATWCFCSFKSKKQTSTPHTHTPQLMEDMHMLNFMHKDKIHCSQGFLTIFHRGPKEVKKYMLEGQMITIFWAFPIYFYVCQRWSTGQK